MFMLCYVMLKQKQNEQKEKKFPPAGNFNFY